MRLALKLALLDCAYVCIRALYSACCEEEMLVSARDLCDCSLIHGHQHVVLGIVGKYGQALSRLSVPTLLLGLCDWPHSWLADMGIDSGQRGGDWPFIFSRFDLQR